MPAQTLTLLRPRFGIEHHACSAPQLPTGDWWAMSRTPEGVTVLAELAEDGDAEPWRAFYNNDAHDLDQPGMLAAIVQPLAAAGLSVFAASTYQADLVLVAAGSVDQAVKTLEAAGHTIVSL
ncbi:ACT domain-containing protein [Kribbella sp. DT2]|uniref:ACT domain-containing protein n=1 Tax=Kribbella sp. DT2 TaxID=3393427 RepID=UPI003CE6B58C